MADGEPTSRRRLLAAVSVAQLAAGVQAVVTAVVARRPSRSAARALGGLGALQVAGHRRDRRL
jgi:hypothetical protein